MDMDARERALCNATSIDSSMIALILRQQTRRACQDGKHSPKNNRVGETPVRRVLDSGLERHKRGPLRRVPNEGADAAVPQATMWIRDVLGPSDLTQTEGIRKRRSKDRDRGKTSSSAEVPRGTLVGALKSHIRLKNTAVPKGSELELLTIL
jgi:hypothetical protein